jgi:hypothetical protein
MAKKDKNKKNDGTGLDSKLFYFLLMIFQGKIKIIPFTEGLFPDRNSTDDR